MKASFIINARNKAALVGRAVRWALAQTYPCEILLSDQASTDGTYEAMEKEIAGYTGHHTVTLLRCPIEGAYGMRACNQHIQWLAEQATGEWIFQCSADDYSLPERVKVCMQALENLNRQGLDAVGIATTMRFQDEAGADLGVSGYPTETGYVSGGLGIHKMAYGSTIWAYRRDWLLKVGLDVPCTLDVYLGYLASLDRGYYVVANPQHVHYMAADMENMGFQGKMRAAEKAGDKEAIARINELNRYQLFECYFLAAKRQTELYPMAKPDDTQAMVQMLVNQGVGWYLERANLEKEKITPVNR